jgi:hypothetical protein
MNPAGCPASAPSDGDACTMADLMCDYGMTDCMCETGNGGATEWNCSMGGGMMQMCPATEPANGGMCVTGRGDCEFGTRICDCINDTDTWACWDPADCPANPPAEDSACPLVGMECPYGSGGGQGGGDECDCETTGWDCGGAFTDADAGT